MNAAVNQQMASTSTLSPSTVRTYLQRAYLQLNVNNKVELIKALNP